jgi:competence protein ComEA
MKRWREMVLIAVMLMGTAWPAFGVVGTVSGVVNVNVASRSELMLLPGIGGAKAEAIVQLRLKTPFVRIDDLLAVKGIGDKMLAKMAPYIVLSGPTTISTKKAVP